MSKSTVLSDTSLVSRIDGVWNKVEQSLNTLSGFVLFALVGLAVANIFGRKLFNSPIPGYIDWTEQFMILFAFLGLSLCQREGNHIRMDIVISRCSGRMLWFFEWVSTLLVLLLTSILVYGSWFHMLRSFSWDAPLWSTDSTIDIALPLWPTKLIVPFAFAVLFMRLLLQLIAYTIALWQNTKTPVAVPLIETAEQQAEHETESMSEITKT